MCFEPPAALVDLDRRLGRRERGEHGMGESVRTHRDEAGVEGPELVPGHRIEASPLVFRRREAWRSRADVLFDRLAAVARNRLQPLLDGFHTRRGGPHVPRDPGPLRLVERLQAFDDVMRPQPSALLDQARTDEEGRRQP